MTRDQERKAVIRLLSKMIEVAEFTGNNGMARVLANARLLIDHGEHHNEQVYEEFDAKMAQEVRERGGLS